MYRSIYYRLSPLYILSCILVGGLSGVYPALVPAPLLPDRPLPVHTVQAQIPGAALY